MKDFLHLPPCADILVDGCIEVFGLVHPRAGTDETRLNIVLQKHLKRLPMLLIDSKQEKRHHGRDHDQSSHAGAHGVLGYKKQRHTDERAQTEAKDLTLGQVKQELGFDPCQILGKARTAAHQNGLCRFARNELSRTFYQKNKQQYYLLHYACCVCHLAV